MAKKQAINSLAHPRTPVEQENVPHAVAKKSGREFATTSIHSDDGHEDVVDEVQEEVGEAIVE